MNTINAIFDTPIFGVTITLIVFLFYKKIFAKAKNPLLNPLIFSIATIILFLYLTGIDYEYYNKGGSIITFFLGPLTVSLAVPLYKQIDKLKENAIPILISILMGSIVGVLSVIGIGKLFGFNKELLMSLTPKATTTAIAIDLSNSLGGKPAMTVAFVVVAGTTGYMIGEPILNLLGIKSSTAKGIAFGTASHAFGTNKALSIGEEEGAMSSLAIGIAGIITAIIAPIIVKILNL